MGRGYVGAATDALGGVHMFLLRIPDQVARAHMTIASIFYSSLLTTSANVYFLVLPLWTLCEAC